MEEARDGRLAALDLLLPLAAIGGLTVTVLLDLPVHASPFAASDLKTLYASAWCMRHGLDAYNFGNLQTVFQAQGITPPTSWYGHAPVYPPSTLAMLAPLTLLSMAHAAYLMTALSALLMVWAAAAMLRYAEQSFGFSFTAKAVMIALFAIGPLFAFALSVGNLSIPAAALCIFAFARRGYGSGWAAAIALAVGLSLKPHLAVWMLLALLLLPERRDRAVAVRAGVVAIVGGCVAAVVLARGQLQMQVAAFFAMVRSEVAAGGSMSTGSREALPVVSQITSLHSLLGFWTTSAAVTVAVALVLAVLLGVLVWQTRRVRDEHGASLAAGTWCAFGLLTTYHRAHDATLLLVLAPWLVDRLRRGPRTWQTWATVALYAAMSLGPQLSTVAHSPAAQGDRSLVSFLMLRQAALASCALFLVLLSRMFSEGRGRYRNPVAVRPSRECVPAFQNSVSRVARTDVTATTSQ